MTTSQYAVFQLAWLWAFELSDTIYFCDNRCKKRNCDISYIGCTGRNSINRLNGHKTLLEKYCNLTGFSKHEFKNTSPQYFKNNEKPAGINSNAAPN